MGWQTRFKPISAVAPAPVAHAWMGPLFPRSRPVLPSGSLGFEHECLESKPRHIVGIPGSGEKLIGLFRSALEQAGSLGEVHLESVESMEQAVVRARELAGPGDYVLLSPAAPSFGQYRDYQHRAEDFINCIRATSIEERT